MLRTVDAVEQELSVDFDGRLVFCYFDELLLHAQRGLKTPQAVTSLRRSD